MVVTGDAILSGQVISLDAFVAVYYYNIKLYVIFFEILVSFYC